MRPWIITEVQMFLKKLLLVSVLIPLMAFTATETVDGITWSYTVNSIYGEAEVTSGTYSSSPAIAVSTTGAISIPSTLGGYPVTRVGYYAFYNCCGVTSVKIPSSVKYIEDYAFSGCSGLTSMTIPPSVTSIGSSAFFGCNGLTNLTLPFVGSRRDASLGNSDSPSYESLFGYIFGERSYSGSIATEQPYNGSLSRTYYIPSSLKRIVITDETKIGYGAFYGCSGLSSVVINSGVTRIGTYAFYCCYGLRSLTIPVGVTSFGSLAFVGCNSICSITVPGKKCDINFDSVTNLVIAEGTTRIGSSAFSGCGRLKTVTIPSSVTTVGTSAFEDCNNICSVTVPGWKCGIDFAAVTNLVVAEGVTRIESSAFSGCGGLKAVTIPSSVMNIGSGAFSDCGSLNRVDITDLERWCKIEFGSYDANPLCYAKHLYLNGEEVKEITMSEDVTSVGSYVFSLPSHV